jgi:glucokinase
MMDSRTALGIDLGGTNLRVGVVNTHGELLSFLSKPLSHNPSGRQIVSEILELAKQLPETVDTFAVGLALAGAVLPDGIIRKELTNLAGLDHFPLLAELEQALGKPCYLENDATLALLGEYRFGVARGQRDVLLLTLGTGIGGALLLSGVLRRGPHHLGWEVGMLPFPSPTMASLTPFEQLASPKSIMRRLGDPDGFLYAKAAAGDPAAQEAIQEMYRYLGWLVTSVHLTIDLEQVILSGGLASIGEPLRSGVQQAFRRICPLELQFDLQIVIGALPHHSAGVFGAACLCFEPHSIIA